MSHSSTLHSRLKVLVAKAFRAEKIYSSIPNSVESRLAGIGALGELANELRAKEWQKTHQQLRNVLNDLLGRAPSSELLDEISAVRHVFQSRVVESSAALDRGSQSIVEATKRQEFAHVLKMSVELIRHRARAQASQVIVDELSAILETSGRGSSEVSDFSPRVESLLSENPVPVASEQPATASISGASIPDNVIPIRRAAQGR